MAQYFMVVNGQQTGPYAKEELLSRGLKPDSMVWTEGMQDWQRADSVPDLAVLVNAYGQGAQSPNQHFGQSPDYGQQAQYGGQPFGYGQQNPYMQPQFPQEPYGPQYAPGQHPQPNNSGNIEYTNWIPWAIVALVVGVFCGGCLAWIFAILGMTKASSANKAYQMGDVVSGNLLNSSAKTMTLIALIIDVVAIIGVVILFATGLAAEMAYSYS